MYPQHKQDPEKKSRRMKSVHYLPAQVSLQNICSCTIEFYDINILKIALISLLQEYLQCQTDAITERAQEKK